MSKRKLKISSLLLVNIVELSVTVSKIKIYMIYIWPESVNFSRTANTAIKI